MTNAYLLQKIDIKKTLVKKQKVSNSILQKITPDEKHG